MDAEGQKNHAKEKEFQYLDPRVGGGPHGLGDPDDRYLRVVEKDICIPAKMREKAKVLCKDSMEVFAKCATENGLLFPFKCRAEGQVMRECMEGLYSNEEFIKESTEDYLKQRSEYRKTGIKQTEKKKPSTV